MIFAFLNLSGLTLFVFTTMGAPSEPQLTEPLRIGDRIRNTKYNLNTEIIPNNGGNGGNGNGGSSTPTVLDTKIWLSLDDWEGYYFFDSFELWDVGVGDNTEVWIQVDRSWPDPDPHDPDREYPDVTPEQVETLLTEFESNILPTTTGYFGTPNYHNGSNAWLIGYVNYLYFVEGVDLGYAYPVLDDYYESETGKNVILVSNVRDENYHTDFPYYIAGFYSSSLEFYFDRNIISIDSYEWDQRVGPDGDRPYLYEGVIAHEYQHLIHDDYNPADPSFMNEGCSMYAEYLCDYGWGWGDIESFLATPDNSLTEWGDQGGINILADYGAALLWSVYLNDRFGEGDFLSYFTQAGIPGEEGIEAAIDYFGKAMTFDEVFHDWRIANLIHSDKPGNGKYNYKSLDLDDADEPLHINEISESWDDWTYGTDFGTTETILGYDTYLDMVGTYGTDYISMKDLNKLNLAIFDGESGAFFPHWEKGDYWLGSGIWYSGNTDLLETLIGAEVEVAALDPWLNLTTYWDIEDNWDFGFVQVSTDGGLTWSSLENEYTTDIFDPNGHPNIEANLPGLTSWSGFITVDGIVDMAFNLSAYAGQTILIGFRFMTDWAFTYEGWYILDAIVSSKNIMADIQLLDWVPEVNWMVTIIEKKITRGHVKYYVHDMCISDLYDFGISFIYASRSEEVFLVVSPIMEKGTADYSFRTLHHRRRGR
jgi:hypothetical protein